MQQLSHESIQEIREHFSFFDRDGNGSIDVEEFTELLKVISPDTSEAQAITGFELVDENNDSLIEFEEFLGWWQTVWYEF